MAQVSLLKSTANSGPFSKGTEIIKENKSLTIVRGREIPPSLMAVQSPSSLCELGGYFPREWVPNSSLSSIWGACRALFNKNKG